MKRRLLICLGLALVMVQASYSEDLAIQRVGLQIDKKAPNYNIDRIFKKVILSVAESVKKVYVVSSDGADLETAGMGVLNGSVMLKMDKKAGNYRILLYEYDPQTGKTGDLIDDTLKLSIEEFSDTADDLAIRVIDRIAARFPPKPLKELTKIDMVRIKLSEYESLDGFWSFNIIPSFSFVNLTLSIAISNNSMSTLNKNTSLLGGDLEARAVYRIQQWTFGIGVNGGAGYWNSQTVTGDSFYYNITFRGMIGYGFFGSLFVLGVTPLYYYTSVNQNYELKSIYYSFFSPNIVCSQFRIGPFLQINISKDFNFRVSTEFPMDIFHELSLDFTENGKYTPNKKVTFTNTLNNGNGFMTAIEGNFRIAGSWWLNIFYENFNATFDSHTGQQQIFVSIDSINGWILDYFTLMHGRLGLGVRYDF